MLVSGVLRRGRAVLGFVAGLFLGKKPFGQLDSVSLGQLGLLSVSGCRAARANDPVLTFIKAVMLSAIARRELALSISTRSSSFFLVGVGGRESSFSVGLAPVRAAFLAGTLGTRMPPLDIGLVASEKSCLARTMASETAP